MIQIVEYFCENVINNVLLIISVPFEKNEGVFTIKPQTNLKIRQAILMPITVTFKMR